jgi:hypothetical protein
VSSRRSELAAAVAVAIATAQPGVKDDEATW